jgi:hypothetical protein
MKTRVTTFTNLVFSLTFCLGLASCNKEDFYEKEFLDNPFQDSTTSGSVDSGSQAGVDSGSVGGTQGGVDTGVNGGTTGSSTGSSSTGGVDGSTTGGNSTGSTVGGTDGSATAGSTTGSTVGGTDGSATAGSTTGATVGGTDGSATAGSTTGSNTTGGSSTGSTVGGTDGSSTGGTTGSSTGGTTGVVHESKEEIFHQAASQTKKLDIVWIIDNSGSMSDEQQALGTNFSAFIDEFITKDVDFKMGITTTDTSSSTLKGKMVTGSDTKLTSAKAKLNETQFKSDFRNLVKVGTSGSGSEKGLEASEGFMQKYAASFIRPDAYLAVVILSDEEDQSAKTVAQYTDILKSYKSEAGLVKVYSIVDVNKTNSGSGIATGGDRYIAASNNTAGVYSDIRSDFHSSLTAMGDQIINLLDSFALASDPVAGSLKVYVNGALSSDYTFDAVSRSIKFDSNHLPPVGAEVKVTYLKQ